MAIYILSTTTRALLGNNLLSSPFRTHTHTTHSPSALHFLFQKLVKQNNIMSDQLLIFVLVYMLILTSKIPEITSQQEACQLLN